MSKLVSLKNGDALPTLKGLTIHTGIRDGNLLSLRLTDVDGKFMVIENAEQYSRTLSILQKAPPETEQVFTVIHTIGEQEYRKEFTDHSEARDFFRVLERINGIDSRIEEGERQKDEGAPKPPVTDDDLPF